METDIVKLKNLGVALFVVLLAVVAMPTSASAATIVLTAVDGNLYQQSVQNPCIFENDSCQQPAGFNATDVPNQGNVTAYDLSVTYTGQQLLDLLNGQSLELGLDVNEAPGKGPQTLSLFTMAINGTVIDTYSGFTGNVPAGNNGNGYADYLLTGFTSFLGTDSITFNLVFADANDGAENVFLIGGSPTNTPVPEPATMLLLGTGLLAAARARRRTAK